jgi:hypothetical protein
MREREKRRLFSEAQPLIWFLLRSTVGSVVVFAVEGVEGLLLCCGERLHGKLCGRVWLRFAYVFEIRHACSAAVSACMANCVAGFG